MYYKIGLLKLVKQHLKCGGVIAYPTESCFGLGCDPGNYRAINKILKFKQRNKIKGLIVISSKFNYLNSLVLPLSKTDMSFTQKYWPGAYSFILEAKKNLPNILTGKHNSLAVRLTKHKLVRQLCNYLHMALVSTSANKSGFISIKSYRECSKHFGRKVLVLPGTTLFAKKPSTIIRIVDDTVEVLREGEVKINENTGEITSEL